MKREDRVRYPAYAFSGIKSAYRFLACTILFLACCLSVQAQQTYPVQVYTQLLPPYTPHIPAYYTGTQQKLKVMLINTDMQQPTVNVYLRMKILSSSLSAVTPPEVYTPQIELQAGMPVTLSLNDLEPYFKKENLRVSGGQSEFYRTQMLPDNFYRFHFEVYEVGTNRLVSNTKTGFAQAMIAAGEPPILNLPQKGTVIKESNIPSIMFSWTPKHMNSVAAAYGTEYDISLVEIYDKQVTPEAAFDYSRVLYTETTKSTSFIHTAARPLLIPGMRYAWRVQAKAREGVDEISVFKNNGYSPVSWFDYTADCKTVQSCGAIYENGHIDISWQDVGTMEYTVEYRKKGTSRWYTGAVNRPLLCQLYNLQAGKDYEYRIGSRCVAGDAFLYNDPQAFHIPDRQENGPNCGLMPDISLTNRTPARELQSGMPVLVGDFPVFITKVSGSGRFTGEGYVGIPYLQGAQVAVTFKDIVVNTDNRLVEGFFETKYDTRNNNMLFDGDQYLTGGKGVGDIRSGEEKAAFKVDYTINPDIKALPVKADGTKDEIKEGTDYTISKGENGKYTFILTDSQGKEHKVEADSMPATIEDKEGNTYEVNEKGEVKPVSKNSDIKLDNATRDTQSKLAVLSFKATANTKYALDEYRDVYEKVTEYNDQYKTEGTAITASAKFMLPGASDEIAVYIKENKDNKLIPEKVRFITGKGKEYLSKYDSTQKQWFVTVVAGDVNDGQELYAVQEVSKDKYETLGKLNIFTYEPINRSVTLVPVNGQMNNLDKQAVQNGLNEIYGKVGIHWTVNVLEELQSTKEPFGYTPKNGSTFNVTGSGLLSMFTDDMKAINEAFKQSGEYQEDGLYLFVLPYDASDKGEISSTGGDMPLGSQFGYLFPGASIRTIAHEVGHGAFNLEHPFDRPGRNSFPQKSMLEYNLMDYPTKDAEKWTELVKIQWDATRAPGHVIGLFQTDKSGMISKTETMQICVDSQIDKALRKNGYVLGVNGQYFKISDQAVITRIVYKDTSENPAGTGAVSIFKENGKTYVASYDSNSGKFISYKESGVDNTDRTDIQFIKSIQGEYHHIEISKENCTVSINGTVYTLTKELCDCDNKAYKSIYAQSFAGNYNDIEDSQIQEKIALIASMMDTMEEDIVIDFLAMCKYGYSEASDNPGSLTYYFKNMFRIYSKQQGPTLEKFENAFNRLKIYNEAYLKITKQTKDIKIPDELVNLVSKAFTFGELKKVSKAPFSSLTGEQRLYLLDILSKANVVSGRFIGSSNYQPEDIILVILETTPSSQWNTLYDGFDSSKLLYLLMQGVDGGNFNRMCQVILENTRSLTGIPSNPVDIDAYMTGNRYVNFDNSYFGRRNTETLNDDGTISLSVMGWFDPNEKIIMRNLKPFEKILVSFVYEDNITGQKQLTPVELPAFYVYALFNEDTNAKMFKSGMFAIDILSLAVGVGEVKLAISAANYGRMLWAFGDIAVSSINMATYTTFENEIKEVYPDFHANLWKVSAAWGITNIAVNSKNVYREAKDVYDEATDIAANSRYSRNTRNTAQDIVTELEKRAETDAELSNVIRGGRQTGKLNLLPKLDDFPNLKNWVSQLDDVTDANLISKLDKLENSDLSLLNVDIAHSTYGSEIKALLRENPDDLTDIWKQLKTDPAYSWELSRVNAGSRWEKWSQREFFKDITGKGRAFEETVCLNAFKNRASKEYQQLKQQFMKDFGKDLDDYDMYSQVQLYYNDTDYFIADQIFVKYTTNQAGKQVVDDILVLENKLSVNTPLTSPQSGALKSSSYRIRSKIEKKSVFDQTKELNYGDELKFNKNMQWYKIYDGTEGTEIKGILNIK